MPGVRPKQPLNLEFAQIRLSTILRASHGAVEYFPVSTEMYDPFLNIPKSDRRCKVDFGSDSTPWPAANTQPPSSFIRSMRSLIRVVPGISSASFSRIVQQISCSRDLSKTGGAGGKTAELSAINPSGYQDR